MKRPGIFCCIAVMLVAADLQADVRLASIFGDNMVLQRGQQVMIFGWSDPATDVEVTLDDQIVTVQADDTGRWVANMNPIEVGDPFDVVVKGNKNTVAIKNCVAGEVWICSGQSNMEWRVKQTNNAEKEIATANFPLIRHCDVVNRISPIAQDDVKTTGWQICSPETAGNFTAVGFYFGRELHQELNVPIGLINTTWGGTIVEAWTSGQSLKTHPDFKDRVMEIEALSANKKALYDAERKLAEWNKAFNDALITHSDNWQDPSIDDSDWAELNAPGIWETQGHPTLDGVAWYRKTIDVPEGWSGKDLKISLAKVDDIDHTYVNGELVGNMTNHTANRVYDVPAKLVKRGKMSIAVRVADGAGGGGIHGDKRAMKLIHPTEEPISLSGKWRFKIGSKTLALGKRPKSSAFSGPNNPTALYNAMVNGLVPISFRGAIWYQGESNAGRAYQYRSLFPLLIQDWRQRWNRDDDSTFSFYWVQLANFTKPTDSPGPSRWAELREAQSMTLSLPKTGEAVIIDIGEARDIHPRNKQDVGKRLALHALVNDYGKDLVYSGPRYKDMHVNGQEVHLSFDHVGGGLIAKGGELKRFEIAGSDKIFHWATATIYGDIVAVSSEAVKDPIAVRYAWADNPEGCNLYNAEGLPASPFRTDDWPGITVPKK